jgi:hypothetical protein
VVFTPRTFDSKLVPDRPSCKRLLEENAVQLRGWDYPHIPRGNIDNQKMYFGADYCEGYIDWGSHKELMRFYQSGLFVHYFSMWEDWMSEDGLGAIVGRDKRNDKAPGSALSFIGVTYTMTEIYEFLRRQASGSNVFDSGVTVELKLHNVGEGRSLESFDANRIGLFGRYISNESEIVVPTNELNKEQLLNDSKKNAIEAAKYIFETFGWENMPVHVFEQDQQRLLERRF